MIWIASIYIVVAILTCSPWSVALPANGFHHRDDFPSKFHRSHAKRIPSPVEEESGAPTPAPTGASDVSTTVHISNSGDFTLLLPRNPGGVISDAESEAVSFCYGSTGCANTMPDGFITGAHVTGGTSGSAHWIQVTGCIDPSKYQLSKSDGGGQFDVRYPQGAQCTFGGYGASFIEQVEPSASRFCMRCCSDPNDQTNCNSHYDRDGCLVAVPGVYTFGTGVSCDS